MVSFQEFLSKLHPQFDDCPSPCARTLDDERPRDLPDFCAECDVRAQERFFRESAESELAKRFEAGECAWSLDGLYEDVLRAMKLAGQVRRGRYPRGCDALTARVLDVVRREQRRPERIRLWELEQKARSRDG